MTCPRCQREATGWPLQRADVCSPKEWASCLRNPETIIAKQNQLDTKSVKADKL